MENVLNLNDFGLLGLTNDELLDIDGGNWAHIVGGALLGALAGAQTGVAVGSAFPGIGNVAGAIGGAVIGAIGGGLLAS